MEYLNHTLSFHVGEDSVLTLGKFDGLHRGHELLMQEIKRQKELFGLRTIVFTFDIPPQKQIDGTRAKVLTVNEEKRFIFEKEGIDYLIECPFTREVMCMEPEEFIRWITEALSVKCIVVGSDFCFGHNRAGNYALLQAFGERYGYRTVVLPKVKEDGRDISSTFVREEIEKGDIGKANHLLGYPYFVKGDVIHGNRIGRKMGFPTINMALSGEKLVPPFGVYVTRARIGGVWYRGVSNIGKKPTVGEDNPIGLETFLFDFEGDVYEQNILIEFFSYLRPERRFDSLEALQAQIRRDIDAADRYYENITDVC